MSRVAKMPVVIPAGIKVSLDESNIVVQSSSGELKLPQNQLVKISVNNEGSLSTFRKKTMKGKETDFMKKPD